MEQLLETSKGTERLSAGEPLVYEDRAAEHWGSPEEIPAEPQRRMLDLFDVLLIFARRKWMIALWTLIGILCGLVMLLRQPTLYSADAVILPPQEQQASSAIMGQFGALAGFGGMGMRNSSDLYIGLLQSRTVLHDMAERFDLKDAYHLPNNWAAAGLLGSRSRFNPGRDFITIVVEDTNPKRAADLANGYVDELYRVNNRMAIGEAAQRRQFFEKQLAEEKDRLADAEIALKNTQLSTGVLQLSGQTETVIRAQADLQANITNHEVALAALRSSATEENPEVVRLRTELAGLRQQLNNLQKGKGSNGETMSASQLPAVGLEYIRKSRDVQYHQTLFDLLARQLEAARIDEAKAAPTIQVIDRALVPAAKSWPSKGLFLGVGAILGFVLGCVRCAVVYLYDFVDEDPRFHEKFVAVKRAMRLRT